MATLFADENFPQQVVEALRARGHDVLTADDAGLANQGVPDEYILDEATRLDRALLTLNRWEFVGRHAANPKHAGLVVCTEDPDTEGQAVRIEAALRASEPLAGKLIRVNRPSR